MKLLINEFSTQYRGQGKLVGVLNAFMLHARFNIEIINI